VTTLHRSNFAGGPYDLLVIGGGITGAALAHEAASRGLATALVERGDFGAATSAATGKLIHGGLRYLKKLEVALVRESLAERRNLMRIAPNLVEPIPIVLPNPGLVEHAGLLAYDALAFDRNRLSDPSKRIPRHRGLGRAELDSLGLWGLKSGIMFHDAMMISPERLTLAFLRSAAAAGADIANYAKAERLTVAGGRVAGAEVTDAVTGQGRSIRARAVVNATGAWARDLLAADPATAALAGPEPKVRSEGIYLVTRQMSRAMVLTVLKHGHFSFAPWRGLSLVGPTETPYRGPVDQWRLTRRSVDQFVERIAADNTGGVRLTPDDVLGAYGGLRPLTESAGVDTYTASRAHELVDHGRQGVANLLSATGGKYTSSRAFASRIVTRLSQLLGTAVRPSRTAATPLDGCDIGSLDAAAAGVRRAGGDAVSAPVAELLAKLYGQAAPDIAALMAADERYRRPATSDQEPLAAVVHVARHEAPVHLTDIVLRRTGIGQLGDPGEAVLAAAADIAAEELGWDAARRASELAAARRAVQLPQ
jgi:glycerol-3-phosphate dehydrogenase